MFSVSLNLPASYLCVFVMSVEAYVFCVYRYLILSTSTATRFTVTVAHFAARASFVFEAERAHLYCCSSELRLSCTAVPRDWIGWLVEGQPCHEVVCNEGLRLVSTLFTCVMRCVPP